ncbi:MAG: Gfo/Idh/MocA family oxidoreductase [Rickettsiales bacterium]
MSKQKIAVIGCGYWGKNLVRNMAELGVLSVISDADAGTAAKMQQTYDVPARSIDDICKDESIDGVVIASSAATHAIIATQALEAGKHVFVEKPIALKLEDADKLAMLAQQKGRILMVGHLLQYHPAFEQLVREVRDGRIGDVRFIGSNRMSFGKIRTEENVLWSFSPHDFSMILALVAKPVVSVSASAAGYVSPGIADIVTTQLTFEGGVRAQVMASWLHPQKEHKLTVIGDKGALVFDDTQGWESKLTFIENIVGEEQGKPIAQKGEVLTIPLQEGEPLKAECQHFLDAMAGKVATRTHAHEAISVLKLLSAAEKSIQQGKEVTMEEQPYFIHPTAVVDDDVEIGDGTKIWHFSHILSDVHIGKEVIIGQNVMAGPKVSIGDDCKIQNNVSLYKGVHLEEGVFCGPSCVFTNVNTPRAQIERKDEFLPTNVGRGATIGANATIVCGNDIGAYSLIGAGAVVTKEVLPHALVVGNPAKQIGWVSHAGERLGDDLVCPREGRRYQVTSSGTLEEITEESRKSA